MLRQKLDASMNVMQFNHSDFYDLYLNSRRNDTLGVRHEQPETEGITDKLATPPPAVPTDLEAFGCIGKYNSEERERRTGLSFSE